MIFFSYIIEYRYLVVDYPILPFIDLRAGVEAEAEVKICVFTALFVNYEGVGTAGKPGGPGLTL